jgi:predicted DNA-binding transcriptional regulator YafY
MVKEGETIMFYKAPPYKIYERVLWAEKQLKENRYPNTKKMAEEFEVTTKTAQRTFDFMRDELKRPIEYSPKHRGWHYFEPVYTVKQITLTQADLVALLLAEKLAQQYRGMAIEPQLTLAFRKVLQAAGDTISVDLESLSEAYSFEAALSPKLNYETLSILSQAILEHRLIHMVYFTASTGKTSSRTAEPYNLRNFQGEWYLIALDCDKKEIRVFHTSRIRELTLLEEKFIFPNTFDLNKYTEEGFSMIRGSQKFHVELIFDEYQSRWIRERPQLHPTEQRSTLPDGSLKIIMTVTALDGVKRFVMQYGSHVQVIKPLELRQEILSEINKMQDFYK